MNENKMNPEVKEKWLKALRSGEYAQTVGVLATNLVNGKIGYCCLGVLCELAPGIEKLYDCGVGFSNDVTFDREWELLPESVMKWAGLESKNPTISIWDELEAKRISCDLAELNDHKRWDFNKIADAIEAEL